MKQKIVLAGIMLFIGLNETLPQTAEHVVLISIDGFRPVFYTESKWATVNLHQLAQKGVCCEYVRGIFPTVTYPSHTTLITGCYPAEHGVYYNTTIDSSGKPGNWIYDFKEIKVETLWEAAKKAGLTTASVSWPVSVNSTFIDYNIPEIWSFENPMDRRGATSTYCNPPGLFEEVVQYATGEMEMNDYNLTSLSMDDNLSRIAGYIIRKYKPDLLTIHFPNTDGAEHKEGLNGELVERAIANADHAVGYIYDALSKAGILENTAIIVTGDHGFANTHTSIAPNVWLRENELLDKAFFFSAGGSAFLHLKNTNDNKTTGKVKALLESQPEYRKKLFRIVTKEEMKAIGADPDATLALTAIEGFSFNNDREPPLMRPSNGGKHGYYPDFQNIQTGFIGYGKGLKSEITVPCIGLEDIAPIVANLLGFKLENAVGIVYPGILETIETEMK